MRLLKWGVYSSVYLSILGTSPKKKPALFSSPLILRLSRQETPHQSLKIDHHNQKQRLASGTALLLLNLSWKPRRAIRLTAQFAVSATKANETSRQHLRFPTRHDLTVFHCACNLSITPSRRTSFGFSLWIHYSVVVASKLGNSEFPPLRQLSSFLLFPLAFPLFPSFPPLLLLLLLLLQDFFSFFMPYLFLLVLLYLPRSSSYKYRRFSLSLLSHLPPILFFFFFSLQVKHSHHNHPSWLSFS